MTRITLFLIVAIGGILIARPGVEVRDGLVRSTGGSARPSDPRDDGGLADDIEDAIVDEHNRARQDPQAYALQIEALRRQFDGNYIRFPGERSVITQEGVRAVDEAIEFLKNTMPLPALIAAEGMARAASDHVDDQGPSGATGHDGSDGSKPWDRVGRYGSWDVVVGENLSYGPDKAARVVMGLIIDDGVPDRGHRDNIFSDEYKFIGVACGPHKTFRTMCAVDYAAEFTATGRDVHPD
jgi:uncharacterized protein YkwD